MSEVTVRLIEAEALKVGPDEVLIVSMHGDVASEIVHGLAEALEQTPLKGRFLVIGADAELAIAKAGA